MLPSYQGLANALREQVRILDFSERGQGRKTELVEACDFMGIKPKNSSWNHGFHG